MVSPMRVRRGASRPTKQVADTVFPRQQSKSRHLLASLRKSSDLKTYHPTWDAPLARVSPPFAGDRPKNRQIARPGRNASVQELEMVSVGRQKLQGLRPQREPTIRGARNQG